MKSFRRPADRDYALARHLWFSGDFRQYSWAAAQALEKYFKAALLTQDDSVINYRHDLNKLWDHLGRFEHFICPKFYPVPAWLAEDFKQDWPTSNAKYIRRLNTNGSPDARYDGEIIKINPTDLHVFDLICEAIRNAGYFQQPFDIKRHGPLWDSVRRENHVLFPELVVAGENKSLLGYSFGNSSLALFECADSHEQKVFLDWAKTRVKLPKWARNLFNEKPAP